jgi:hypothetical protein
MQMSHGTRAAESRPAPVFSHNYFSSRVKTAIPFGRIAARCEQARVEDWIFQQRPPIAPPPYQTRSWLCHKSERRRRRAECRIVCWLGRVSPRSIRDIKHTHVQSVSGWTPSIWTDSLYIRTDFSCYWDLRIEELNSVSNETQIEDPSWSFARKWKSNLK